MVYRSERTGEPLRTLEDANAEALKRRRNDGWRPSGVACPDCGSELQEYTRSMYMTMPPQVDVRCEEEPRGCGYKGRRFV